MAKLVSDGFYQQALSLYSHRISSSMRPNKFTFPPLFKACTKLNSISTGQTLHTHLIKTGFCSDVYAATALTSMYMKFQLLDDALKVFAEMSDPKLESFNATISGLSSNGCFTEAFWVFREAGAGKFRPNSVTIAGLLPACESVELGMQVHCWAIKIGVVDDVYVATSLLTMYSDQEELVSATELFKQTINKTVVCYNAFITGLLQNGVHVVVFDVFKDMRRCLDDKPDSVTLVSVISACAKLCYLQLGRQVHGLAAKIGMSHDTIVGTGLLDMYSKCGCWHWSYSIFKEMAGKRSLVTWNSLIAGMMLNGQNEVATDLFEMLVSEGLSPDSATWNSMISGFSQLGHGFEAFKYFKKMQSVGVNPSLKSITSLLPVCSALSFLKRGKEIHGYAIRTDFIVDEFMATGLIDMYMKCGMTRWARMIFDQFVMKPDDPAFWNAMICGYGVNGEHESAFEIFDQMLNEEVIPNSATFVAVLSACGHTGELEKGWKVFKMMISDYELNPRPEHFGCMVDLLGRCGKLQEARELINEMPNPSASVFHSLLGACQLHSNSEIGEEICIKLLELEPENSSPIVILSNIYAQKKRWEDAERIRQIIGNGQLRKILGSSSTGVT